MLKRSNKQEVYQNYIADTLRYIVNNTAGQEERSILKLSYRDMVNPVGKETEKDNEKEAKAIINKMKNKLKGG